MRSLQITLIFFFVSSILFAQEDEEFKIPKSTVDAAERRLDAETDPNKRLQLILRWIRIKEEYEKGLIFESDEAKASELTAAKQKIIERLESEIERLYQYEGQNLEPLFRQLGFRYLETKEYQKSYKSFLRIQNREPADEIALGDAYVQLDMTNKALEAYGEAADSEKLKNVAAYKSAWAYMRLNDFENALKQFDLALEPSDEFSIRLREEAFTDRLRPYLETFSKETFDQEEAQDLRATAVKASANKKRQQELYVEALKSLVEGFTAMSEIEKAQNAFFFLSEEIEDTTEILILSAPTWIKVYRGRLDHAQVERIIIALPKESIPMKNSTALRAELYNTAVFYETYLDESTESVAEPLLRLIYSKYFQLYPTDPDADDLRVNYATLLLKEGDAGLCLELLEKRSGTPPEVEKVASTLEGKCELKHLDQLFEKEHNEFFYKKLRAALVDKKVYLRPGLGISAGEAFQQLSRMLIGALKENVTEEMLRDTLGSILEEYPYPENSELLRELKTVRASIRFEDLLAARGKNSEKAEKFYEIFQDAPEGSQVAEKALRNSIVMGINEPTIDRCNRFQEEYPEAFKPGEAVFDRCIVLSEHFLALESEYEFWKPWENELNEDQTIRLGLLEIALDKPEGRKRIEVLRTEKAARVLEAWDGVTPKKVFLDPQVVSFQKQVQSFLNTLKPIKFSQIGTAVPSKINAFERLDGRLLEYYNSSPEPVSMAEILELRAKLASKFAEWFSRLPEPPGLTEEELDEYRTETAQVYQPWKKRAEERRKECGEIAHSLSVNFKNADTNFCPELAKRSTFRRYVSEWRNSIQRRGRTQKIIRIIVSKALRTEDTDRAKYYLFRALDLSKNDRERARVELTLAKVTGEEIHWYNAAALDGALVEPLEWLRDKAEGNPFFEKLYDYKIRFVKRRYRRRNNAL